MNDVIILKSGKWQAGVCPRLGGNLISLSYDGKNVLRPLVDESQIDINPYLQGAPILLPANRTYQGKFSFEGENYQLPVNEPRTDSHLHGLVHRQPFSVVSQSDKSITMSFVNTNGLVYPFDFEIIATYTIDDEGLSQEFTVKNIGKKNMPYTFCLHTTFMQPEHQFTFPLKQKQEAINDIPTGRYIELNEVERRFVTGSPAKDVTAYLGTDELINYQNQLALFKGLTIKSIEYKNGTPGDDIYVTFTKNGVDYDFCVERYLTGPDTEVYKAFATLAAGDVVDVEGFVYWYNAINTHITNITKLA